MYIEQPFLLLMESWVLIAGGMFADVMIVVFMVMVIGVYRMDISSLENPLPQAPTGYSP